MGMQSSSGSDRLSELSYHYRFQFESTLTLEFDLRLDRDTLAYLSPYDSGAEGVEPGTFPCRECPIREGPLPACPVITNVAPLMEAFEGTASFDRVAVEVESEERTISNREITLQKGLSSMLGIIMVTSGCPDLDMLRPMVRLHLPFASLQETAFRAASTYLLANYMRSIKGLEPDWSLQGLVSIYRRIEAINHDLSQWLRVASSDDANPNALVILDVFAKMMPKFIEHNLAEFEPLFAPHMD